MIQYNFWQQLAQEKSPFSVLAPMYDVTDTVFRQVIARRGRPDVWMTEFVSADALAHPVGREKVGHLLKFDEMERYDISADGTRVRRAYLVAQIFGANPETIEAAARYCAQLGFDGIDINMGCPEKNIQKQGAGAALIQSPKLAGEIVAAARAGAGDIPVSVKTRVGYNYDEVDTWIAQILAAKPAALTVHLRTKKEMSEVPAHWEWMRRIVKLRNLICNDKSAPNYIPIIGNGDVASMDDARVKTREFGCDGVMLGRAVFGNPWLFAQNNNIEQNDVKNITQKMRLTALREHTQLYNDLFAGVKSFAIMKKHFGAYIRGFDGASAMRAQLMEASDASAAIALLDDWCDIIKR